MTRVVKIVMTDEFMEWLDYGGKKQKTYNEVTGAVRTLSTMDLFSIGIELVVITCLGNGNILATYGKHFDELSTRAAIWNAAEQRYDIEVT